MQLASGTDIPDGLLAAKALLSEKLHQGSATSTHTLHQGFGSVISHASLGIIGPLYDSDVRSRCTGKERDAESGLDYFGARYYGSTMGRFMSPDWAAKVEPVPYSKLDNPQSLNLYQYMRNNPLSGADPDGHCDWCQKLLNGISGNGFQTNAQLASANAPTTVSVSETYTPRTNTEPTPTSEPKEPNDHVDLAASAVGLLSATPKLIPEIPGAVPGLPALGLGISASTVSVSNDTSNLNLSINGTATVLGGMSTFAAEGTATAAVGTGGGLVVAVGAMGWSASNWFTNQVLSPMSSKANFDPNAPPTTGPINGLEVEPNP